MKLWPEVGKASRSRRRSIWPRIPPQRCHEKRLDPETLRTYPQEGNYPSLPHQGGAGIKCRPESAIPGCSHEGPGGSGCTTVHFRSGLAKAGRGAVRCLLGPALRPPSASTTGFRRRAVLKNHSLTVAAPLRAARRTTAESRALAAACHTETFGGCSLTPETTSTASRSRWPTWPRAQALRPTSIRASPFSPTIGLTTRPSSDLPHAVCYAVKANSSLGRAVAAGQSRRGLRHRFRRRAVPRHSGRRRSVQSGLLRSRQDRRRGGIRARRAASTASTANPNPSWR